MRCRSLKMTFLRYILVQLFFGTKNLDKLFSVCNVEMSNTCLLLSHYELFSYFWTLVQLYYTFPLSDWPLHGSWQIFLNATLNPIINVTPCLPSSSIPPYPTIHIICCYSLYSILNVTPSPLKSSVVNPYTPSSI